jgi:hypothetical protein
VASGERGNTYVEAADAMGAAVIIGINFTAACNISFEHHTSSTPIVTTMT